MPQVDEIFERYRLRPLLVVVGMLFIAAVIGAIATPTKFTTLLTLVSAAFIYLVLPGYVLLLNVELDDIERVVLSTAVGIGLIPLILFNLNLFWFRISKPNVLLVIFAVIVIGVALREKESIKGILSRKIGAGKKSGLKQEPKDIKLTEDNILKG